MICERPSTRGTFFRISIMKLNLTWVGIQNPYIGWGLGTNPGIAFGCSGNETNKYFFGTIVNALLITQRHSFHNTKKIGF